jgi:hypothetical protein
MHNTVRAGDVKVHDFLGNNKVTSVQSVKRQGLYAPVTASGKIFVSGVLASCYVNLVDSVAPSIQVYASHAALAPLRIVCMYDATICKDESHYKNGISSNLTGLADVVFHISGLNMYLQWLLLALFMPVLVGLVPLEFILVDQTILLVAFLAVWPGYAFFKKLCSIGQNKF